MLLPAPWQNKIFAGLGARSNGLFSPLPERACPVAPGLAGSTEPLSHRLGAPLQSAKITLIQRCTFAGPCSSRGAIAQLGERIVRNDEVVGSIPTSSTILRQVLRLRLRIS